MKATVTYNDQPVEIDLTDEQLQQLDEATKFEEGRPKCFKHVLGYCKETQEEFDNRTQYDRPHEVASKMLELIVRTINKNRKSKYDGSERHYYPAFDLSGSGFSRTYFVRWCTHTPVGPRLEFFSVADCEFAAKQFGWVYKQYML